MISFNNDYSEGAHQRILDALNKTNYEQTTGYGTDEYTAQARELLRKKISCSNADIYFLSGGTQTNTIALSHIMKPYEAVISCTSGHIARHETGAIESTGHKVIEMPGKDFKLTEEDILKALAEHTDNHMVKPKVVYISNTTEMGTHYTKNEIASLSKLCREKNLYLYIDGARLASALAVEENNLSLEDYARYADIFYIGGTKSGLLFGEALVVVNDKLKEELDYTIKQRGGLFAKGRLLGVQFLEMFQDDLYIELGKHSNEMALKIKKAMLDLGYKEYSNSHTNQQFFSMTTEQIEKLSKEVVCSWENQDENGNFVVRFVTSWATKKEDVEKLIKILEEIK